MELMLTGATGAVGAALLQLAQSAGWNATGIYCSNHARAAALLKAWSGSTGSLDLLTCDLTDPSAVRELFESLPGDYIYLPEQGNRSVSVDARGILAALDHVYDADRLVVELTSGELVATDAEADAMR